MANVLEKIVADKKDELVARKAALPLETFIAGLTPSKRSLYQSLSAPEAGFILECKKASPSKGLIREDFDLEAILNAYKPYAAGISVLTDEKYFQGKFEYLEYVCQNAQQPVLNKDFFVDPYQVYLARHYGADAILLMLSVLDDDEYQALAQLAKQFDLDILTEVSNEEEAHRALALGANIIGINNRNLRDLSTDLAATERLVPLLRGGATEQQVIISESGIYTQQDVRRLAPLVQGFLVGSSLMAQDDIESAVKTLLYGTVKVCGMTRAEDIARAKALGATYAGLIFAEKSPRKVTLEQAQALVQAVPFQYVGVFVDAPLADITQAVSQLGLAAVQLHGNESADFIAALRDALPSQVQIWRAKGVAGELPDTDLAGSDKLLLDCKVGDASGGTGQSFDWGLLKEVSNPDVIMVAGGLNPNNVKAASQLGVAGLDINSGVESAPGVKDAGLMQSAFSAIRDY